MSFLYSGSLWSSLYCGISSLCVGLYRWLVKVSWLGKLVSVFWWVELYFFSLEWNEMSSDELWDVYGFWVTLGSLYIGAQGCDFVVVVVVFNEFKDLSFSFYTLASPWNTYLCQQPQTLTSAGLVSVNGFLFSQFLFFTVLPMLPFWVRFTGSLVWN